MTTIEITPWTEKWAQNFLLLKSRLNFILSDFSVRIEHVGVKTHTTGRSTVSDKQDFKKKVTRSMKSLQKNKIKIKSFFGKKSLRYAA